MSKEPALGVNLIDHTTKWMKEGRKKSHGICCYNFNDPRAPSTSPPRSSSAVCLSPRNPWRNLGMQRNKPWNISTEIAPWYFKYLWNNHMIICWLLNQKSVIPTDGSETLWIPIFRFKYVGICPPPPPSAAVILRRREWSVTNSGVSLNQIQVSKCACFGFGIPKLWTRKVLFRGAIWNIVVGLKLSKPSGFFVWHVCRLARRRHRLDVKFAPAGKCQQLGKQGLACWSADWFSQFAPQGVPSSWTHILFFQFPIISQPSERGVRDSSSIRDINNWPPSCLPGPSASRSRCACVGPITRSTSHRMASRTHVHFYRDLNMGQQLGQNPSRLTVSQSPTTVNVLPSITIFSWSQNSQKSHYPLIQSIERVFQLRGRKFHGFTLGT